jgi:hypothetical protein
LNYIYISGKRAVTELPTLQYFQDSVLIFPEIINLKAAEFFFNNSIRNTEILKIANILFKNTEKWQVVANCSSALQWI